MNSIRQELAFLYLRGRGYKILMREYECALGKVDIVSKVDNCLVFSLVVANKATEAKKNALKKSAAYYLKRYGIRDVLVRFEVISVRIVPDTEPMFTVEVI